MFFKAVLDSSVGLHFTTDVNTKLKLKFSLVVTKKPKHIKMAFSRTLNSPQKLHTGWTQ